MTAPDPSVETEPDDVSEAGESETLAESPTTQPDAEAEPDAAAVAAEAGPSEPAAVESAVEPATPEEATTTRRRDYSGACLGVGRDHAHGTAARDEPDNAGIRTQRRPEHAGSRRGRPDTGRGDRDAERPPRDDEPVDVGRDHERRVHERECAGRARGPVIATRRRGSRRRTRALAPWQPALRDDARRARQRARRSFSLSSGLSRKRPGSSESDSSQRSAGMSRRSPTRSGSQRARARVARAPSRLGSRRSRANRRRPTSSGRRPPSSEPRPSSSGRR